MSTRSHIEYVQHTVNPWWGCVPVSPGCDHCYAERDAARFQPGAPLWGTDAVYREFGDAHWREPVRWNRAAERAGTPARVLCASMADWADLRGPAAARERLWALIRATPWLHWLLLTKRIGNVPQLLPLDWGDGYVNVWLGATVCNQPEFERDVPKLLAVPARIRWLSVEPMLSEIDALRASTAWFERGLAPWLNAPLLHGIHWIVGGGESGPQARPTHPLWATRLRDQCIHHGVPFFWKQWGEWVPRGLNWLADGTEADSVDPQCKRWPQVIRLDESGQDGRYCENADGGEDRFMQRMGKRLAGRYLGYRTWDELPEAAR